MFLMGLITGLLIGGTIVLILYACILVSKNIE